MLTRNGLLEPSFSPDPVTCVVRCTTHVTGSPENEKGICGVRLAFNRASSDPIAQVEGKKEYCRGYLTSLLS